MKRTFRSSLVFAILLMAGILLSACDSTGEEGVQVVRYSGPEITPTSALAQWKVSIDQNGVVLLEEDTTGTGFPNPVSIWNIAFLDTGNSLPEFISLTVRNPNGSVGGLVSGTVYIQDWDLEDVISGEIEGEMRPGVSGAEPNPLVRFWVDLSEQPALGM